MKQLNLLFILFFIFAHDLAALEVCDEEQSRRELLAEHVAYEKYQSYINEIKIALVNIMEKELNLQFSGDSGILHEKIEMFGMQFHAPRHATVAEARALQLYVMNTLISLFNQFENIQPFLKVRPFSYGQVKISISFAGDGDSYNNGNVVYVSNVPETALVTENINKIFYCGRDPFTRGLVNLHSETYEEATRINDAFPIKTLVTHQTNEEEKIMALLLNAFEEEIREVYGIRTRSIGWKSNKGIEEIAGNFTTFRRASQDESRHLMLQMIDTLLLLVNDSQTLKSYLIGSPFSANQLKMRLSFSHKKGYQFRDNSMESVVFANNELIYYQSPPRNENVELDPDLLDLPVYASESYQEAKKKAADSPVSLYKFKPPSFFERAYDTMKELFTGIIYTIFFFFYS